MKSDWLGSDYRSVSSNLGREGGRGGEGVTAEVAGEAQHAKWPLRGLLVGG